ncbi:MAG: hypothetical protein JO154_11570 [Chitinophaga sp.]|uniref:hypothetical protein n=1 Tax=Chitinophaga sp. TaxID=1869181 RepID=UPI0025BEE3C1|nr:hypothetical protein [Chitinophaga sp.]MBV8253236.1 hypothetical protein [Chitinophaga sp.]
MPDYLFDDFLNAELLLPLFLHKDITVNFAGNFARAYSADIRNIVLNKAVAQLTLNRNGLYHQLPEGLFHASDCPLDQGGMEAVTNNSRHLKQEAAMACLFFQPMEQVMFEERCRIYHHAVQPVLMALLRAISGCKEETFLQQLIPFLAEMCSCKSIPMAIALISKIIKQPVSFHWKRNRRCTEVISSKGRIIAELGVDLVLGDVMEDAGSILSIDVGPVTTLDAPAYLPWSCKGRFLRLLAYLLLPAAVEIDWKLLVEQEDHICMLGGYMYC